MNREEKLISALQNIYSYIGPVVPEDCPEGLDYELQVVLEILRATADEFCFELPYTAK